MKIGAKVIAHGRYLVFQMAEVAVPRKRFRGILRGSRDYASGPGSMLTRQDRRIRRVATPR